MMHKYHHPDNPGFTDKRLSSEQWENAYNDLKRAFRALKRDYDAVKLKLEQANEWRKDYDVGC